MLQRAIKDLEREALRALRVVEELEELQLRGLEPGEEAAAADEATKVEMALADLMLNHPHLRPLRTESGGEWFVDVKEELDALTVRLQREGSGQSQDQDQPLVSIVRSEVRDGQLEVELEVDMAAVEKRVQEVVENWQTIEEALAWPMEWEKPERLRANGFSLSPPDPSLFAYPTYVTLEDLRVFDRGESLVVDGVDIGSARDPFSVAQRMGGDQLEPVEAEEVQAMLQQKRLQEARAEVARLAALDLSPAERSVIAECRGETPAYTTTAEYLIVKLADALGL